MGIRYSATRPRPALPALAQTQPSPCPRLRLCCLVFEKSCTFRSASGQGPRNVTFQSARPTGRGPRNVTFQSARPTGRGPRDVTFQSARPPDAFQQIERPRPASPALAQTQPSTSSLAAFQLSRVSRKCTNLLEIYNYELLKNII